MLKKLTESTFKKISYLIIAFVLVVSAFLGYGLLNTRLDYDFEKFFPTSDEDASFFFEHRAKFESDNDFLLLACERKEGVFEKNFLKKVSYLSEEIGKLDKIQYTRDITHEKEFFIYQSGQTSIDYITKGFDSLKQDEKRIFKNQENINTFISKDKQSLCIQIRHEDFLAKKYSEKLLKKIIKLADAQKFENYRLAGRIIGQKYYIDKMNTEMTFFIGLSMILVVVFLFLTFKSLWGIILPQVVIVLSMVWVLGFMGAINEPINILLTILPSIMFIVSMSDVIHLMSKYLDLLRTGLPKFDAIKQALEEIGLATFLTSITTSIGFLSLIFISVQPIQVFGLYAGLGVMIAFLLTFLVLPVLFYYTKVPKLSKVAVEKTFWAKFMHHNFLFVLKKRKLILIVSAFVIILFSIGTTYINANNFLMDDLKPTEQIKKDFNFLDKHYGGVRPFELAITLKDTGSNFWNVSKLKELDRVEAFVKKNFGAQIIFSLPTMVKTLNRSSHSGMIEYYTIPESKSRIRELKQILRITEQGRDILKLMLDSTQTVTRMSGMMADLGNDKITILRDKFDKFIKHEIKSASFDYKITGTPELLDKNMKYLAKSLIQGLALSILIVAILMALIYRSIKIVLISLIPNLFPLIVIGTLMAVFGIDLKLTTAIIFTISFGIAVDDTIHFLGKFKYELNKGKSTNYAVKRAFLSTGKAMILTTLILCAGFTMLVFSDFMGTFYMGLMISVTLFVALIADLYLLPVLLILFYQKKKKEVTELDKNA